MEAKKKELLDEKSELDHKRKGLIDFMHTKDFGELLSVDQGLHMVQLTAMQMYTDALTRRIELLDDQDMHCLGKVNKP